MPPQLALPTRGHAKKFGAGFYRPQLAKKLASKWTRNADAVQVSQFGCGAGEPIYWSPSKRTPILGQRQQSKHTPYIIHQLRHALYAWLLIMLMFIWCHVFEPCTSFFCLHQVCFKMHIVVHRFFFMVIPCWYFWNFHNTNLKFILT